MNKEDWRYLIWFIIKLILVLTGAWFASWMII